jgi:glutaredoxin
MYAVIQKLIAANWTVYLDTSKCGYCVKQVKFLGEYMKNLQSIHCDDSTNAEKCKKIKAYPTWERNGKLFPGSRFSIDALEKLVAEN